MTTRVFCTKYTQTLGKMIRITRKYLCRSEKFLVARGYNIITDRLYNNTAQELPFGVIITNNEVERYKQHNLEIDLGYNEKFVFMTMYVSIYVSAAFFQTRIKLNANTSLNVLDTHSLKSEVTTYTTNIQKSQK